MIRAFGRIKEAFDEGKTVAMEQYIALEAGKMSDDELRTSAEDFMGRGLPQIGLHMSTGDAVDRTIDNIFIIGARMAGTVTGVVEISRKKNAK